MIKDLHMNEPITGQVRAMNPKKFAMWLIIVSIVMLFISLSSAYIVQQSDVNWPTIELPSSLLLYSSLIIVISSITMHWAFIAAKRNNLKENRLALLLTTLFAGGFIWSQVEVANFLTNELDINFTGGHAAESFLFMFGGLHIFHLLTGIMFLLIMLLASFQYKVHSRSLVKMEMCTTYWHFLGGLWLYLFLFLELNN